MYHIYPPLNSILLLTVDTTVLSDTSSKSSSFYSINLVLLSWFSMMHFISKAVPTYNTNYVQQSYKSCTIYLTNHV